MTVEREDLWRLYDTHVAEYRFQIQLNTQRYQWYTALDVALITVGAGLLRVSGHAEGRWLASLVFFVGLTLALFTMVSTARQVGYQHAARAQAKRVTDELGVTDYAIMSTPGWRGGPNRWWTKVRTANYALLAVLGAVNVAGFVYVVA